jgi:hypothetical protein
VYATTKVTTLNFRSSVLLALVFDLSVTIQPPVARGAIREMRSE